MLDSMMGHGGRFWSLPQQNKCSKYKTEFVEQFIDLFVSLIKPHSFSNY